VRELVGQMDDIAVWVIAVLGAVAAIGGAMRWIVKKARHVIAWCVQQAERLERVDELAKELRPNGGRSIKDVTDETATAVADLQAAVAELKAGAEKLGDKFAIHVIQAQVRDSRLDEIEAAVTYLAEDKRTVENLSDAIGPALRATPHECDAPHPDDPAGP
jgi:hypothetical protein